MQDIDQSLFAKQAASERKKIALLESFVLPKWQKWEVNWLQLASIVQSNKRSRWNDLEIYRTLLKHKRQPAVYCFYVQKDVAQLLFDKFKDEKRFHAEIRKSQGIRNPQYRSMSYINQQYNGSSCMYVGSRKFDIHERFKQHLGYGAGRTGALHLAKLFDPSEVIPPVFFYYVILENVYRPITERIEAVVQNTLKPFIGKNILDE